MSEADLSLVSFFFQDSITNVITIIKLGIIKWSDIIHTEEREMKCIYFIKHVKL